MMSPSILYVFSAWGLYIAVVLIEYLFAISYARHRGKFGLTTLMVFSIIAPMFGQAVYLLATEPDLFNATTVLGVGFGVLTGALVTSLAFMLVTGSVFVFLISLGASVVAGVIASVLVLPCDYFTGEAQCMFNAIVAAAVVWHSASFAGLFIWGARKRGRNKALCYYCDYELPDSANPMCPECGAAHRPPVRDGGTPGAHP